MVAHQKTKNIVSGLDTKINLRVYVHSTIMTFVLLKQGEFDSNDRYLTECKLIVHTLKIVYGDHILVSKLILNKKTEDTTTD